MQAEAGSAIDTMVPRVDRSKPAFPQFRLLFSARRSRLAHIFPEEIVACMIEARRPASHEVEAVAAKIWDDIQIGLSGIPWRDVVRDSRRHRQMLAAARIALEGQSDRCSDGRAAPHKDGS